MPTSAPGSRPGGAGRARQRGLTLIEALVVIAIMALLTAVVVATAPPGTTDAEAAARAFRQDVIALSDEAVVTGRALGLAGDALSVLVFTEAWEPARTLGVPVGVRAMLRPADEVLAPDPVPEGTLLIYRPPGEPDEEEAPPPPVRFGPTGEVTPFAATFADDRDAWRVTVDAFGDAEVIRER